MALANILWSISFHDRYKHQLIKNVDVINRIEAFRTVAIINKVVHNNIYVPRYMSSFIKKSC